MGTLVIAVPESLGIVVILLYQVIVVFLAIQDLESLVILGLLVIAVQVLPDIRGILDQVAIHPFLVTQVTLQFQDILALVGILQSLAIAV